MQRSAVVLFVCSMLGCSGTIIPGTNGYSAKAGDLGLDLASPGFDLSAALDDAGCGLVTCASVGANCGPIGDGCGGVLECGRCVLPQTCGGGGVPSVCGGDTGCKPRSCADQHFKCGPAGDGCGNTLDCGKCTAPETCGGGGQNGVCGGGGGFSDGGNGSDGGNNCVPRTCAQAAANCGPIGDGCGAMADCGTCALPDTCGGGGKASTCGRPPCSPRSCVQLGFNCGPAGDGCGGQVDCGKCTAPDICGGGGQPGVCGGGVVAMCVNLCKQQVQCDGGTTTVSGVVYAPTPPQFGSPDPLFGALVYVPNAPVQPFAPGVSCDKCGTEVTGTPLVSATTGADGKFVLQNVPVGMNVPLVIQLGRWRRQVVIPSVLPCTDNPLPASLTRLPRNQAEGDIPLIAMVTGNVDTLECVLQKIGLDQSEFSVPSANGGTGRVQFYLANGADVQGGAPTEDKLWGDAATLAKYDMVLFSCEGAQLDEMPADQQRIIDYTALGGRVFATHYSYVWLYNDAPFSGTANWNVGQAYPPDPLTGIVDQSFPKGKAFATWLGNVGAASGPGQIAISNPRHDLDAVVAPAQRWIYSNNPDTVQHYTFNTPVGVPAAQQCGRVLFSDFHVANVKSANSKIFPTECTMGAMSPQEKVLEFMLFDLASCIAPDVPPVVKCTPKTCKDLGFDCGPAGDGCGNLIQCGSCPAGRTCGGGGTPGVCGNVPCAPRSCAQQGVQCGPAGDGCGNLVQCGTCPPGQTCGGGGKPGVCGSSDAASCQALTCAQQMIQCGPAGDGCGGLIQCGNCPPGQTCGGGGTPGVCGNPKCAPRTCVGQGIQCGPAGDGCGGLLQCGSCPAGQSCGGSGKPGICGVIG